MTDELTHRVIFISKKYFTNYLHKLYFKYTKKVMERVARRFLLHNRRENEEVKESDFDEVKQELNMAKYEVLNKSEQIKGNLKDYESVLHKGFTQLGHWFYGKDNLSETGKNYQKYFTREMNSESRNLIETEDDLSDPFDNEVTEEIKS
jgi:hypothetical protein